MEKGWSIMLSTFKNLVYRVFIPMHQITLCKKRRAEPSQTDRELYQPFAPDGLRPALPTP